MKCAYCQKEFKDYELDLSHDVPRYLGGVDTDGRHYLCKEHHNLYEKKVLVACLNYIGERLESDEEIILWMKELKKQSEILKRKFRIIAKQIRDDFYGT